MTKIITHSGRVHFDDFFSVCLILAKDKSVNTIERKAEVSEEDLYNNQIWKVDIGEDLDEEKKIFDHHQQDIVGNCAFSLLLESWGELDRAKRIYPWIESKIESDEEGFSYLLTKYRVKNFDIVHALDSFVENVFLEQFQVNPNSLLKIMRFIGKKFFEGMEYYEEIEKDFKSKVEVYFLRKKGITKEKSSSGIPCIMYLSSTPCYGAHLSNIFYNYKKQHFPRSYPWIEAFRYDRPKNSIYVKLHGDPDKIDLRTLQDKEKGSFGHKKGFMATVENMSELELAHLIQSAFK